MRMFETSALLHAGTNTGYRHVFAWLQLLRVANVLTAVADVAMGYIVTHGSVTQPPHLALLAVSSCLLYLSGMVLNDVFDADVDVRDRPGRPIPSGRISPRAAAAAGCGLLTCGVLVASLASYSASDGRPALIAMMLAACIVLYDAVLKRTPLAPIAMGACRALNVLFGMSLATSSADLANLHVRWASLTAALIAAGLGIYIVGVTIFARTDAHTSSRGRLLAGLAILLGGMLLLAAVPFISRHDPPLMVQESGWYLLWAVLALVTGRRCTLAVLEPSPARVQAAVRHCVQSVIVLDAAVTVGYAGPLFGLAVLVLIFPTVLLAWWLRAT